MVAVTLLSVSAAAQDASPTTDPATGLTVVSPDTSTFGGTAAEWAAAWSRWWDAYPDAAADCAQGQGGPVWFLPGVPADTPDLLGIEIACTVPSGTGISMPILGGPNVDAATCETINQGTLDQIGGIDAITLRLDGQQVPDLARFQIETTSLPPLGTPTAASAATPSAGSPNTVTCGYFLLLAPPSDGEHTVQLTVAAGGTTVVDITWRLTVGEPTAGTPAP